MIKKEYTAAIQRLLYCFPLYNYINENQVNVLVLGFSDIVERFVDFAFEMAQVNGYKLNISIISDDIDAKIKYLNDRPAFVQFFNVDEKTIDDDYGTLSFKSFSFDNISNDISNLLLNEENRKYSYIFIGTDNDDFNCEIAKVCVDCKELLESNYVISCVSEINNNENDVNYIHRNDTIKTHKDYKILKSMAFNCHLVWNDSKLLDMRKLQRQFLTNYNFISCMNYVISLKYKLASIGMDFLDTTASEKFDRLINSKSLSEKKLLMG